MTVENGGARAGASAPTLDGLFRRAGVRRPQDAALVDPPDRERFTDGAPRRLTYAEADRAISAFAARLRGLGLAADTVVAIQLPNTVEGIVAFLGVLRAGMIAAPLPLLWRTHDMIAALRSAGAKAIVTCARTGSDAPVHTAMQAASEVFAIRHVCCFGRELPDGVTPLDDLFESAPADPTSEPTRQGPAAFRVAAITFDVGADGIRAVPRNHLQLVGGGLVPFLESALAQDSVLLSTIPPTSFAGLALGVVPWLLAGGTLALHQDCDPSALAAQCADLNDATVVLPGPAAVPLNEAGILSESVKSIVALWRAPERMTTAQAWRSNAPLIDVAVFGEVGLIAAPRGEDGMPAPLPHGRVATPRGVTGAVNVLETACSRKGTLLLRGPMVPGEAYQGAPGTSGEPAAETAGYVETGYPCRRAGHALTLTGSPAGIAVIGGCRLPRNNLETLVAAADAGATIMAVPDGVIGERLAGAAADPDATRATLRACGLNPLVSEAFRAHGKAEAA
jgi:non-ribosomal peptide synthetase component E (peptide arylation enzyme)